MKESLSSFDIAAAVKDLQRFVGGHVDKIYHPDHDHLVLAIKVPGGGKEYLHFYVGRWIYMSETAGEMPQLPSDFAMMLRKRIANGKIGSIRQQGFERIAVLSLEKDGKCDLVLELFGDGNAILVKDGVIVQPLTTHTWKHRDVRARKEFMFPPPVPDPSDLTAEDLHGILAASDADIVRTLATKLNLGGRYSEEICARLDLDRHGMAAALDLAGAARVLAAIRAFREEALGSGKGYIVLKGDLPEDVVPVNMKIYGSMATVEFPSFSKAVEEYISRKPKVVKVDSGEAERQRELERLKRRLAQQEAAVIRLQDEGREAQMTGDALFGLYADVSKALAHAQRNMADRKPMDDTPGFVSYDAKNAVLTVRIGTATFTLDAKGTVESSAQRYYGEAKRSRKKLEGVLAVLDDARKAVQEHEAGIAASKVRRVSYKPSKRFWFERFRWFISSEGAVVLGGKDAKSNDMLVKKHLDDGDRYAHADMHGAPSVVVKMKEGVTERTLMEACKFAVATSKAWNAKIGSAAGYWVLPEQVSKTPQSGEYLAKGAFVIRGKRNYADKLEVRLAVGEILFEKERKIMGGPVDALRTGSKRFVVLRPGSGDRNALSKRLSDLFEVPIEEVQSIMPPGDVEVIEQVGLDLDRPTPRPGTSGP